MTPNKLPEHTSHSQIRTYLECPHRYYLERVEGHQQTPHLAGVAGRAFHQWSEDYDHRTIRQSDRVWLDYLGDALLEEHEKTGVDPSEYLFKKGEGWDWWVSNGVKMQERYMKWREESGWTVATGLPSGTNGGTTGVEYGFTWQPAEGRPHVGFVDRIFETPVGLVIVDIKTGAKRKTSQLLEYYAALRSCGVDVRAVTYWWARNGKSDDLNYPTGWNEDALLSLVQPVQFAMAHELYPPKVSDGCRYCPMRGWCKFYDD